MEAAPITDHEEVDRPADPSELAACLNSEFEETPESGSRPRSYDYDCLLLAAVFQGIASGNLSTEEVENLAGRWQPYLSSETAVNLIREGLHDYGSGRGDLNYLLSGLTAQLERFYRYSPDQEPMLPADTLIELTRHATIKPQQRTAALSVAILAYQHQTAARIFNTLAKELATKLNSRFIATKPARQIYDQIRLLEQCYLKARDDKKLLNPSCETAYERMCRARRDFKWCLTKQPAYTRFADHGFSYGAEKIAVSDKYL